MKKFILIIFISSLYSCTKSQSWESAVCDCIETNYNYQSWNYFDEIESFEQEMIERNKISKDIESKIDLLDRLGEIEYVDFYKHQFSERLLTFGEETIHYCLRRALFHNNCDGRHWSIKLVKTHNYHKALLQKDGNIKLYNKSMASSIIKTVKENSGDNRIKDLIILQELYRRIPDESWYRLDQANSKLRSFNSQSVTTDGSKKRNIIEVSVNGDNVISVEGNIMPLEKVKATIKEMILNKENNSDFPEDPQKVIIAISNNKNTSYKMYLDVYNQIKEANAELRMEKSLSLFNKPYNSLNKKEQKQIKQEIPFIVSESEPTNNKN